MKKHWKELANSAAFLAVFAVVLWAASMVVRPKDNTPESGMHNYKAMGFLAEPEDTIDILAIGDSNMQQTFSPMLLWHEKGYTSYTCGSPLQKTWDSYYLLDEFLERQSPRLVIFETDGIFSPRDDTEADAANEVVEAMLGEMFPVVTYHDRWKDLTLQDIMSKPVYTWKNERKGFRLDMTVDGEEAAPRDRSKDREKEPMRLAVRLFLDRFAARCQREGIALLFITAPSMEGWDMAIHNTMQEYTKKHGIPYLDLNLKQKDIGIDWEQDTSDGGTHLNLTGSHKVTRFLADYIGANYDIVSHAGDGRYAGWDEDYEAYEEDSE